MSTPSLAVLIATADRPELLERRALPSIATQTRPPSRTVVVDDSSDTRRRKRSLRTALAWRPANIAVDRLRNRRTKGAAGAWNSGLDHLLRTCRDPRAVFVALLDDDDQWEPHHLADCAATAAKRGLDMVATPFLRLEEGKEPQLVVPPTLLDAADFLVGNPGIQASNLVCRLSVLLEAGLFGRTSTELHGS